MGHITSPASPGHPDSEQQIHFLMKTYKRKFSTLFAYISECFGCTVLKIGYLAMLGRTDINPINSIVFLKSPKNVCEPMGPRGTEVIQ